MATILKPNNDVINGSGIDPLDKRVIVLPDVVEEKIGNVFIPDSVRDQKKFAMQTATVTAVGELAWSEAKNEARIYGIPFTAPVAGDRVRVGRHTGEGFDGPDGRRYVLLNDADILGRLAE